MKAQPDLLIRRMQNGNEAAFSRMYARYNAAIHGVIFAIVKDEAISQEILQDVFVKIWEKCDSYDDGKGRFFTWAISIARNSSIDYLRSKDHKNSLKNLDAEEFVDILEAKTDLEKKTDTIGLSAVLERLRPMCQKIIDTIFFKGFTFKDGAKKLDMPEGTLKTRNRKCIQELRDLYFKG
jgi:RNA polymerase sigma-70 factor (ECF subfamily)